MNDAADHGPAGLAARLGIFARTFPRATPEEVAAAVSHAGYPLAHWNFTAIGRSTLAGDVEEALVTAVRRAFDGAGVAIPSVSATFNLIHPDSGLRATQTAQAVRLIGLVPDLGADVVMRRALDGLLDAAGAARVRLGIEPEPGNVIRDARTAARLLDELGHDATVGIVLDPANLLSPGSVPRQSEILTEAVALLGPSVIGIQIKDVAASGPRPPAPACWTTPRCSAPWPPSPPFR